MRTILKIIFTSITLGYFLFFVWFMYDNWPQSMWALCFGLLVVGWFILGIYLSKPSRH